MSTMDSLLPAPPTAAIDVDRVPYTIIWETTRACDLRCFHCRADAQPRRVYRRNRLKRTELIQTGGR